MWKLWPFFRSVGAQTPTRPVTDNGSSLTPVKPGCNRMKPLPPIEIEASANHHKSFTSPNPDIKATVYSSDRREVGRVIYAISPLFDRLYLFDITIHVPYRRQGFGLTIMDYLTTTYRLPITTIKELFSASEFWRSVREVSSQRNEKIETLSVSEMNEERERWAHLKPLIDQLDVLISDRLSSKLESWESAIGRGLPDWPTSTLQGRGASTPP
ncbi:MULTISPECIES: hypothetical protein [unclassified Duganella]|uniref:hypothetical protein n=1 Tax=unclassified Duganella TaxID=2636909 RepID=UPI00089301C3|nr:MULTISPECIES: hypothetical protein [unclassified Duganella]OEZ63879.1 hypothetical protein DUGA6_03800 [Duganella sp. HH105]OFA06968.1 hypothetical protein DUGA2_03000 [Duganella sp. HH101]